MEKNKFNEIILKYFKEIKYQYENDKINIWDGEDVGSTIVIEDYLMPFIYKHLNNIEIMNRLSDMLEEFLSLHDDFSEEVLYCSFFEKIHYEKKEDKFIKYFKPKTKEFFDKLKF